MLRCKLILPGSTVLAWRGGCRALMLSLPLALSALASFTFSGAASATDRTWVGAALPRLGARHLSAMAIS